MASTYTVPGYVPVMAQDGPMTCWATVYTMMVSWKRSFEMDIPAALQEVDSKYVELYKKGLKTNPEPRGLPADQFAPFLSAAKMRYQPMKSLPIDEWLNLLQGYGLLWVGTLNAFGDRHSRIITGISGNGNADDTYFGIIDPDYGRRYFETFRIFIAKYEGALAVADGPYLQIRHF